MSGTLAARRRPSRVVAEPNRLLAGEYPGATTPEDAEAKIRVLLDAGIDNVIDRIAELRAGTRKDAYPCPDSTAQHDLLRARRIR